MKMRTTVRLNLLALLACLTNTPTAYAVDTTFSVTATVAASCTVSAGGDLIFGAYTGTQIDQTTTISITCTNSTGYTVGLDNGVNYVDPNRRMKDVPGTHFLNYELYSDAFGGTRWGNALGSWVEDTGSGSAQSKTVYGRLAGGQALFIGSYTDTITVTVTY